jgi:hypothetical protein
MVIGKVGWSVEVRHPHAIRRPGPVIPGGLHLCIARVRLAGRLYCDRCVHTCQGFPVVPFPSRGLP